MNGSDSTTNESVNSGYRVVTGVVFIFTILASIVFHFGDYENQGMKNSHFKFHKLWTKKMLQMAVLKGLAQGFIVNTPRDADVFASEVSIRNGTICRAIIAAVIMLILVNYRHLNID
jgi:YQGE family putative transporter